MKNAFLVLVVGMLATALASADDAVSEATVVKAAKAKSIEVYKGLGKIRAAGFDPKSKFKAECEISEAQDDRVTCTVTDINEEYGWLQGIYIEWYANLGTVPGKPWKGNFQLLKLEVVDH